MNQFGVSFSLHRCSELGIDKHKVLLGAINDLGFRRLRLMSYWNIHEARRGHYDFAELDWQMDMAAKHKAQVTLCLGVRQPRWPEFHMPAWAESLDNDAWHDDLMIYIAKVVERYRNHPALVSWQLENEALLKSFGHGINIDFKRSRLKREFKLIKSVDPKHPVVMTLSDSWGLPFCGPKPDIYALSLYIITMDSEGKEQHSTRPTLTYKIRAGLIGLLKNRETFIHELQAEPWATKPLLETTLEEQLIQMGPRQLKTNIDYAASTNLWPIDLWGLEWWYWLKENKDNPKIWALIKSIKK